MFNEMVEGRVVGVLVCKVGELVFEWVDGGGRGLVNGGFRVGD